MKLYENKMNVSSASYLYKYEGRHEIFPYD